MSPSLPKLPDGWEWSTVGEIASTQLGKMLSAKARGGVNPLPYLRNQNVQWGRFELDDLRDMDFSAAEIDKFSLEKGDLVMCEGGEPGRCAIWESDETMLFQKALHRIRPSERVISEWLYYYFAWLADTGGFARYTSGIGIRHLPQEDLRIIPVPVPPLTEQQDITAQLRDLTQQLDDLEAETDEILALGDAFDVSILRAAFTGALTRPSHDPETLPPDWELKVLADVAAITTGTTPSTKHPEYYGAEGTPFVRPGMLTGSEIEPSSEHITAAGLSKARVAPAGSVLMQCLGFGLGRVGLAATGVAFNQQINASTFGDIVLPRFGLHYLRHMGPWVVENATTTLTPLLNKSRFSQMPFVVPPLEEQAEIVTRIDRHLEHVDHALAAVTDTRRAVDDLRRSLLHRVFGPSLVAPRGTELRNGQPRSTRDRAKKRHDERAGAYS